MKRQRTRNPILWLRYSCWCVQFWMQWHTPYWPMPVRRWALRRLNDPKEQG